MIKALLRLSDDELDRKYLAENRKSGARLRLFQRIRSVGSDPTQPRGTDEEPEPSIFDRVHADAPPDAPLALALDQVQRDFHSPLWQMLAEPGYARANFENVINKIVAAQGWYRATPEDTFLARTFFPDEFAFGFDTADRENVYSTMLTSLESSPCADHLALLAALFQEAMLAVDLDLADLLRKSLRACTASWMDKIGWRDTNSPFPARFDSQWLLHGRAFEHLIDERLVRNMWLEPPIDRAACRNQRQFVAALLHAHQPAHAEVPGPSRRPIVLRSPRIQWLQRNREELGRWQEELAWADHHAQLLESMNPKLRKFGKKCLEYGNKLRALLLPLERDTRYCLPVFPNRGARNHSRAAPYLVDGTLDTSVPPANPPA